MSSGLGTNYDKGIGVWGAPVMPGLAGKIPNGKVFWVNNAVTGASDNSSCGSKKNPFATINYAFTQCTSANDDWIIVGAGHDESVTVATTSTYTAGACLMNKTGVSVIFCGNGGKRGTITFAATDATLLVNAANITLYGPRFVTGIDAVAAAINPQAADFKMYDVQYYDATSKFTTIQVLTTSAASRMIIDGYKFFSTAGGTQKTDGIKLVGGANITLRNVEITGDFSTSPVNISTTTLTSQLENLYLNNTAAGPQPAMTIGANATGFAKNVKCRVASGTTYVSSVAKIQWGSDCEGFSTDGYGGDPIGTALAAGLEGKIDIVDGYFDVPTANAVTNTTVRDVVGNKSDDLVTTIGTTASLMGYTKGIRSLMTIIGSDNVANSYMGDPIGNKADTATYSLAATKSLMNYLKGVLQMEVLATGTFTTSSATVPADTGRTEASSFWKGCILVPLTGSAALQPRYIAGFNNTGGVFTVDAENPFTAATGTVAYALCKGNVGQTVPAADGTNNTMMAHVVGNKSDIAVWENLSTTQSLIAITKGISRKVTRITTLNAANTDMTGSPTIFTITLGSIQVKNIQFRVTTAIPAGANTLRFQYTPAGGGATTFLCAATDTASAAADQLFTVDGVIATALVKSAAVGISVAADRTGMPIRLAAGTIQAIWSAGAPASGAAIYEMQWEPLTAGATVA